MIYHVSTLGELQKQVNLFLEVLGTDTPVSYTWDSKTKSGGEYIAGTVGFEYIIINKETGLVVGNETSNYVPKENECVAIKIS